jgi:hypothetical protein
MPEPDTSPSDERVALESRKGVVIGILIVALMVLGVYFYWHITKAK